MLAVILTTIVAVAMFAGPRMADCLGQKQTLAIVLATATIVILTNFN